ncbi:MAG: MaoC family dehydratase [Proteobacteria bacterium]|nr:MaoC family dehydratase [Pseudomonadota bacterium]MBU1742128.1 MaoC family dehydratase [Pseudomonadota bacterium]
MNGKTISQLALGDTARFTKTVSESDVYLYAGVTGDFNPAHINEPYAAGTFFKGRIAHGMLAAGFISTILGTTLPGPGTIYLHQSLDFSAPVRFGDTITARVEVKELDIEKNRVTLETTCVNQDGVQVLGGRAVVSPPQAPRK